MLKLVLRVMAVNAVTKINTDKIIPGLYSESHLRDEHIISRMTLLLIISQLTAQGFFYRIFRCTE